MYVVADTLGETGACPSIVVEDPNSQRRFLVVTGGSALGVAPVVIDANDASKTGKRKLYLNANGYAYCGGSPHHSRIIGSPPSGYTVDHINRVKVDNRLVNLRWATAIEQADNKTFRCDKLPPPPELRSLGIQRMPLSMRWDTIEAKFIVDHLRISGTKSAQVSLVNKFRDCLMKLIRFLDERNGKEKEEEFAASRIRLADEYNHIVRTAHMAHPEVFPDGPYADLNALKSDIDYCRECLSLLPAVHDGDVLHGALNIAQRMVDFPSINAVGIVKANQVVLLDAGYKHILEQGFPSVDMTGSSPTLAATHLLQRIFARLITEADVINKKKYLLKDLVWMGFLGRPKPDDHTIVPMNYQQLDLRAANLMCLPGGPKSHKGLESVPTIDPDLGINMRFWPRGVSLCKSGGRSQQSPWSLSVKFGDTSKKFACSAESIRTIFETKALPLLMQHDADFGSANDQYQALLTSYLESTRAQ